MNLEQAAAVMDTYEEAMQAYQQAMGILSVDGSTAAPKRSAEGRGKAMGFLSGEIYRRTMAPELKEALETVLQQRAAASPMLFRRAELLKQDLDDMTCVPLEEYTAYQTLHVEAGAVWHEAKEKNDYAMFAPYLEKIIAYQRRFAQLKDPDRPAYDVLLDTYEKGTCTAQLDPFFAVLRERLTPVVLAVKEKPEPETAFLHKLYPVHEQVLFSQKLMQVMGIDPDRCTLAETEHPYTHGLNKWDVRITTKYRPHDVASSMYSVVHEGGHALYELGVRDEYQYTALQGGSTMGIHESQSRFYENLIARSLPYCEGILPVMREIWPEQLRGVTPEQLYAAVNLARPSLVRTEADELTYPMHIMIRYELEKRMLAGEVTVAELPALWNAMYRDYLGIEVPNDRDGVLQDIHWADGLVGYFPSYALGSAYGVQMLREMEKTVPVWEACRKADLRPVTAWLGERIHQHGRMLEPQQLLRNAMNAPFDPTVYTDYLTKKFTELYGL